jgi:uncharacterized delta-60 repeat protein
MGITWRQTFVLASILSFLFLGCSGSGGDGGTPSVAPTADPTPPSVLSVFPRKEATGVSLTPAVTATFSKVMDASSLTATTFTVKDAQGNLIPGTISHTGTTATFIPSVALAPSNSYLATITAGVIDLARNALPGDYFWPFATSTAPDTTPPTVLMTSPTNGATGVALNTTVTATFSEVMDVSSINTTTFTVKDGNGNPVSGTVTYVGATATFTPSTNLVDSTTFVATITSGAKDVAGNALTANYSWYFTTLVTPDTTPPTVISTYPVNGATDVAANAIITATFSEPMDATTVTAATFTVKDVANNPISGVVICSGRTAFFSPSTNLSLSTAYTATITVTVKDLAGNAMVSAYSWGFTTSATPPAPGAGSLDASFGVGGVRLVNFGGGAEEARAIALQPDGKSLVGGISHVTSGRRFALMRLDLNGALDPTFGSGGTVITTFAGSIEDFMAGLAVQPDGKIVAAGGSTQPQSSSTVALARYNADGSLDSTFGSNGTVRTNVGIFGSHAESVALQTDGKIVVGGESEQAGNLLPFTLLRYNSDGSLDPSFGSGGISRTLVGGYSGIIKSIVIQPDGKIVAAGYVIVAGTFDFAFTRFNTDGSVDTSFGINGSTIISISTGDDACDSVRLQSDGKIVGVGSPSFTIVRLTSQGSLDSSFGASGMVTTDFGSQSAAYGLAVQTDGRLIAAGYAYNQGFALARYNTDGSLDTTFGNGGRVATGHPFTTAGGLVLAFDVTTQGDGKIIAAGVGLPDPKFGLQDFAVARFLP